MSQSAIAQPGAAAATPDAHGGHSPSRSIRINRLGLWLFFISDSLLFGMMAMASALDLVMLALSIELVSLTSYVLAGYARYSLRSSEAMPAIGEIASTPRGNWSVDVEAYDL